MTTFSVRLVRPWGPLELELGHVRLSTELSPAQADALLCEWAPSPELLDFRGPRAWLNCEPRTNGRMGVHGNRDQIEYLSLLSPAQMFYHAHEDLRYRVPHVTHVGPLTLSPIDGSSRIDRAVAVISNFGGPISKRWPDVETRNTFVTAEQVDLFGDRGIWRSYRRGRWSLPRKPRSFRGTIPGGWGATEKLELLSTYRVAICLENTCEPWYFTEKFVDAAAAGCIPVYHAHPTVAQGILSGATWVDPARFGFDVDETLKHARGLRREEIARQNHAWLESEAVGETRFDRVFARAAGALHHQLAR